LFPFSKRDSFREKILKLPQKNMIVLFGGSPPQGFRGHLQFAPANT